MTLATLCAFLLLVAGAIHSYSFMCRKLPAERRPPRYPLKRAGQILLDLLWVLIFFAGIQLAFTLSVALGIVAAVLYFVVLPFLYQPMVAKLIGFKGLRDYIDYLEHRH
ncbi:MAG: hypothetical protein GWN87_09290 [Desulfuromonadales bacterium]|nr:hypothetical protein [Desulfuromonadales bacterium]NIS40666.1 hypothetical protein [Desulfuromonadales bacterium]